MHSCVSRVLLCVAHCFCASGPLRVTSRLRSAQCVPSLRVWHTLRSNSGFRPHCRVLCQTLACRPHESSKCGTAAFSRRGSASQPLYRDWIKLAGIGWHCRCSPMPRFVVCAVLPLPLGLDLKSSALPGLVLKACTAGLEHLTVFLRPRNVLNIIEN